MLVALLSSIAVAWPKEVVLQSPESSDIEYQAYLSAHAGCTTPVKALAVTRPSAKARENLVNEFAESQKAFLGGESVHAQKAAERLLEKIPADDWSAVEREIFFKAAFRRAQLAATPSEAEPWLKRALIVGYDLRVDRTLFPPPVVEQYQKLKASHAWLDLKPQGLGREWDTVLVNGRPCTTDACPSVPDVETPLRVTFLSNKWQPVTAVMPVRKISAYTPAKSAWLGGTCGEARFSAAAARFSSRRAFFNLNCAEPEKGQPINFHPVAKTGGFTMFDPPKKDRPFYKSPWTWVGAGAIVAAIIVAQSQKKEEKREPTTTYGY